MKSPTGRGWLWLWVACLVVLLGRLAIAVAAAQAEVIEHHWTIDPQTRLVVQAYAYLSFGSIYGHHIEILRPVLLLALVCISLMIAQLRRVHQERHPRLALVVLPVLVPLLLTLMTAQLARPRAYPMLVEFHGWFSSEELHYTQQCCGLDPCSQLLALDTILTLAPAMIAVVTAILLVPAVVTAWHVGVGGSRLGKGWSRAAILCFLLGVAALVSTRGHRADRNQVLAECAERPHEMHWIDAAPADFHGIRADPCISPLAQADDLNFVNGYELRASGELHPLLMTENLEPSEAFGDQFGEPFFQGSHYAISLYAEEHVPMPVLRQVLEAAHDANLEDVSLLGTSTFSGELATLGTWRRRVNCGLGVLHFDDPERNIDEFESFAELTAAASVDGGLHLELTPSAKP